MHHRWQRIHCDRCLEEQLTEEPSEAAMSPGRKHVCSHDSSVPGERDLIWPGYRPSLGGPDARLGLLAAATSARRQCAFQVDMPLRHAEQSKTGNKVRRATK